MFKPIKDFITFIQKNSSNLNVDEEITTMENLNATDDVALTPTHFKESNSPSEIVGKSGVITTHINPTSDFDADDIELQIKPSIMIKKPSPQSTRSPTPTLAIVATSTFKLPPPDHNHNSQPKCQHILPEEDDELADFKYDPMQNNVEDFCSVGSEIEDLPPNSADEGGDELATEDEDAFEERSYSEVEGDNKLFVAIDSDLNSSITSSNNDDPLAIDITALSSETDVNVNPLDSSTSDEKIEVTSNGEIVWYETDDIENSANIQNSDKNPNTVSVQTLKSSQLDIQKRGGEDSTEETERNDNSDSGLGIETSSLLLQTTIENSITENTGYVNGPCNRSIEQPNLSCEVDSKKLNDSGSSLNNISTGSSNNVEQLHSASSTTLAIPTTTITRPCTPATRKPLRSNLKRSLCDVDATLVTDSSTNGSRQTEQDAFQPKKLKRSITFESVQVYYFPRQQGFGCVPSAGGCTLGMGPQHIDSRRLTLAEHAAELRRAHRLQLQEINPRGSSSEDTDESEEDYLSEGSGSDLDADSNGFLQPVPPKQRRALLKAAGVRKIDTSEKIECRNIRNSREVCGCTCRDFCDPETCTCSRAGIKCQVDRAMFPCGCSRDACGNTTGRVEFNPARVRTHFIHTIMRLDMENRQQQPLTAGYDTATGLLLPHAPNNGVPPAANYYNSIQPQSNYSSGYASPAYNTDSSANYLQQQSLLYPNNHHNETIAANGGEQQYHSMDSIDGGGIYAPNIAPSYGEILPNYAATPPMAAAMPTPFNHAQSLGFPTSPYMSYQQQQLQHQQQELEQHHQQSNLNTTSNFLAQSPLSNDTNSIVHSAYSSCAVPSRPPYGTATTTCSSSSASSTSDTNFISLNTPISNSSRLSQINDLLQHNRNTTAALVAISTDNCPSADKVTSSSIETPPMNENQKACFVFDANLTMETVANNSLSRLLSPPPQSEPPPNATAIDNLCTFNGGGNGGCNYPI